MNETSKKIQLTLIQPHENDDNEIKIDFITIFEGIKRFVAIWLVFAISFGVLSVGIGYLIQPFFDETKAEAIIRLGGNQSSSGQSSAEILNKFRSPTVVTEALKALSFDPEAVDIVRSNLSMTSILPDSSLDRMTLSYNLLTKGGNMEVVDSLLETSSRQADRFLLSFDFKKAGFQRDDGIVLLNEIITAYQNYYDANYNFSSALGDLTSVIDYTEYDYEESASIFSDTLDRILSYLSSLSESNEQFRSSQSGYSFQDLSRIASLLKDIDIDRVNSFIYVHSVSSYDLDTVIDRYEWMIEESQQQINILETQFDSLTSSIASYEKDPVIYALQDYGDNAVNGDQETSLYDRMIEQKYETRISISNYQNRIMYYQNMIERFQTNNPPQAEDIKTIELYLSELNEKISALIENVNLTANEFYSKAAFVHTMQVLVPATAESPSLIPSIVIWITLIAEAILFVLYMAVAIGYGIKKSNAPADRNAPSIEANE